MNILLITNHFNPPVSGGSANSSSLIYQGLREKGHCVDLLVFDREDREKDYKKTWVGKYYRKRGFFNVLNELSKIKDGKYDIIHQYGGGYHKELLPMVSRFKKTKIVTTFNGIWPACWSENGKNYDKESPNCCKLPKKFHCAMEKRKYSMKWFSLIEYVVRHFQRISVKKYDRYFAQSEAIKVLFSKAGFDSSKIKIIPNFYDPKLYEKIKKEKENDNDKIIILYVGGLKGNKGVDKLIKAFKIINRGNVELHIMGDGPKKEMLKRMGGDDGRINFLGYISYKSEKFVENLIKSDIFVHPGIWPEPFNRTILEAAISKTAIIVSDIGAPPEVLSDKALIYNRYDIQGLADSLIELIKNSEKRKKMAEEVHDYVLKEYSLKSAIDKLENEYEQLVSESDFNQREVRNL